ncbi:hypothetical protein VNO77_43289 [Canavalia gladiata]|uniref:Uncharacterized protein n=1 Tax=Canavalia gladiata TaxID=3824 RepID=A0AAN9JW28_CANGL
MFCGTMIQHYRMIPILPSSELELLSLFFCEIRVIISFLAYLFFHFISQQTIIKMFLGHACGTVFYFFP